MSEKDQVLGLKRHPYKARLTRARSSSLRLDPGGFPAPPSGPGNKKVHRGFGRTELSEKLGAKEDNTASFYVSVVVFPLLLVPPGYLPLYLLSWLSEDVVPTLQSRLKAIGGAGPRRA